MLLQLDSLLTDVLDLDIKEFDEVPENCLEDCLENFPKQDKAATSKADAVDLSERKADVSTYITAPICLDIARACSEEMLECAWEFAVLMSDLHPTNTMGVEGEIFIRVGTQ